MSCGQILVRLQRRRGSANSLDGPDASSMSGSNCNARAGTKDQSLRDLDISVLRREQFWRAMNAAEVLVEISTEVQKRRHLFDTWLIDTWLRRVWEGTSRLMAREVSRTRVCGS